MAKILIANDDPATVDVLQRHLTAAGHQCIVVATGDKVIDITRTEHCDLVLIDVMLSVISGFEVCRRIRRDPELYTLPILILSAMNSDEEVFHGLAQGADDYITKPFNPNNLVQRVEALLRANADATGADPITGLHGADSTKRELQRRISSGDVFALVYSEVVGIREFAYRYGNEARRKAICLLGELLKKEAGTLGDSAFVGHMGGGHFVTFLPQETAQAYCAGVSLAWRTQSPQLCQTPDTQRNQRPQDNVPVDVLLCVTLCERTVSTTAQHLFEILSRVRHKALESQGGGIYVDRRAVR